MTPTDAEALNFNDPEMLTIAQLYVTQGASDDGVRASEAFASCVGKMCVRICHDDFKPTNSDGFKEIFSNIQDVMPMAFALLSAVSTLQQAQAVKKSSGAAGEKSQAPKGSDQKDADAEAGGGNSDQSKGGKKPEAAMDEDEEQEEVFDPDYEITKMKKIDYQFDLDEQEQETLADHRRYTERFFFRPTERQKKLQKKMAPIPRNDCGARSFELTESDKAKLTFPDKPKSQDTINKEMKDLLKNNQLLQQSYLALQHHARDVLYHYEESCERRQDQSGLFGARMCIYLLDEQLPDLVHEQCTMVKDAWYGEAIRTTYPDLAKKYKAEDDARIAPGKLQDKKNVLDDALMADMAEEAENQRAIGIMDEALRARHGKRKPSYQQGGGKRANHHHQQAQRSDWEDLHSKIQNNQGGGSFRGGRGRMAGQGGQGRGGGFQGRGRGGAASRGGGGSASSTGRGQGAAGGQYAKQNCTYGDSCTKADCTFWHPTMRKSAKNGQGASSLGSRKQGPGAAPFFKKK
jgi:hypothetical protein